jgi:RNA polymerase sigma-70 factor (sigma-E family)
MYDWSTGRAASAVADVRGGPVEFDGFVVARLRPWLAYATQLTLDVPLAEDIVHDVILKLHRNWPRIGVLDAPDAYVYRMLTNEFLSWKRRSTRIARLGVAGPAPSGDHAGMSAERDALDAALLTLPKRQRAVLVLRYYGDRTDAEIASILGCSEGTVRSHASRGLASLRIEPAAGLIRAEG